MPKYPVPSEASDFRFLTSASAPDHAVLEIDTPTSPIRLFLSRDQLEQLAVKAGIARAKIGKPF